MKGECVSQNPACLRAAARGRYIVTSPAISELLTEGDSVEDIRNAFVAVSEIYRDQDKPVQAERKRNREPNFNLNKINY